MFNKLVCILSLCAVAMVADCTINVTPLAVTTVKAENDLTNLSVDVNGTTTDVTGIDLIYVTIGDVFFSFVNYGTTTSAKTTDRSGNVAVTMDTAVVYTQVLGQTVSLSFSNISPMSATITPDKENTVIFDQSTAGVIFQALGKKKAR